MKPFVYHNPVKVLFGNDKLKLIGKETTEYGNKVLLVHGCSSLKQSGFLDKITNFLRQENLTVSVFGNVQPNPTLAIVRKGVNICKSKGIEAVCGVGGGSVIDTAKAIAAGSLVEHDVWKFFNGKKSIKDSLPILTVPTLAGSGSDMNHSMVITHDEKNIKSGIGNRHLFPKVSFLCPEISCSAPFSTTVYGAVDILSHLLETYLSTDEQNDLIQYRFIEDIFISVLSSVEILRSAPEDMVARGNLLWAASLALSSITYSGLGKLSFVMHLLEHPVSALTNMSHGKGLCAIIPGYLQYLQRNRNVQLSLLEKSLLPRLELIFDQNFLSLASFFIFYLEQNDCPTTLEKASVPSNMIPTLAEDCFNLAKFWRLQHLNQKEISFMYEACFSPSLPAHFS